MHSRSKNAFPGACRLLNLNIQISCISAISKTCSFVFYVKCKPGDIHTSGGLPRHTISVVTVHVMWHFRFSTHFGSRAENIAAYDSCNRDM
ncbi:hypothetical protein FKM82_020854 [Ascaphus truei]